MTTPDIPYRLELTYELPGTPEQVWHAIATAEGNNSWFMTTDIEEREGGAVAFHMGEGEESTSRGTVTGWEPHRRFAYEEPQWAALAGHAGAPVTPLATEFLIEAQSGGTCVLRVVTSGFGTGAEWEREFFAEMEKGWTPFFDHLRLYLAHFPGQRATRLAVDQQFNGDSAAAMSRMRKALGVDAVDQEVRVRGLAGRVERLGDVEVLVQLTDPVPGFLSFSAFGTGDHSASAMVQGYLFSPDAGAYVEREEPGWKAWLQSSAIPAD